MKMRLAAGASFSMLPAMSAFSQVVTWETALVPTMFPETPGEHGAIWTSQLDMFNSSDQAVTLDYPSQCQITCPILSAIQAGETQSFDTLSTTIDYPGVLISIPSQSGQSITFHLRVKDISREAETWGTDVPVVRERDFLDRSR